LRRFVSNVDAIPSIPTASRPVKKIIKTPNIPRVATMPHYLLCMCFHTGGQAFADQFPN